MSTTCETTHRNGSRIFGRFWCPKAESEITVKKLGPKFPKTTAQGQKRARVISLRNSISGARATQPAFFSMKSRENPIGASRGPARCCFFRGFLDFANEVTLARRNPGFAKRLLWHDGCRSAELVERAERQHCVEASSDVEVDQIVGNQDRRFGDHHNVAIVEPDFAARARLTVQEHGALHVHDRGHEPPIVAATKDSDLPQVAPIFQLPAMLMACISVVGPSMVKRLGVFTSPNTYTYARGTLRENGRDFYALDVQLFFVAERNFLFEFIERQALSGNVVETGQIDRALRRDARRPALSADAGPVIDRGSQIVELRVDLERRNSDRRLFVKFRIQLIELLAKLLNGKTGGSHFAEQPQRDGAIGLNDEFAVKLLIGEGIDLHNVAHVQTIRIGLHIASQPVNAFQLIIDSQAVNGHVRFAPVAHIFALGVGLPIDGPHRLPAFVAAVAAARPVDGAVDAHDWTWRGRAKCLAKLNVAGVLERR